jgi:ABC-type lipoprotein release transport system permease subunit
MRTFPVIAGLAFRNLRRHVRRTLLTALAMIVGGALLMISLPLGDGTHEDWIESAVRMGDGHFSIQTPRFQKSRKIEDRLSPEARAEAEKALSAPDIAGRLVAVAPRLTVSGLASSPSGARPVEIVGVDPAGEAAFNVIDEKIVEGRYLVPDDRLSAFIGSGLAESLELKLGSRLVLTAQDAEGEIASQLVRVVGVFKSGVPEIDQTLVHIPLSTAGRWLHTDNGVTNIAVLLRNSNEVPSVKAAVSRKLAQPIRDGKLVVLGWREAMPDLDAAVKIDNFGNYLFQAILFSIIALGIVNTVLMSVLHRQREFGVLQALGLTPGQTGGLVLIEGLVLTTISGVVGIGLGLFITWYFWRDGMNIAWMWSEEFTFSGVVMDPIIVPQFTVARIVQSLVFIFLIGGLASLYPAFRATKIDVTEAMKFER